MLKYLLMPRRKNKLVDHVARSSNATTLEAYDRKAKQYAQETPSTHQKYHAQMLEWIDVALFSSKNKAVLEIGSATTRDAKYMRKKGYHVQCSDAATGFLELLRSQNEDAIKINILTDEIPPGYGLIIANAVIPHLNPKEVKLVLAKLRETLTPGSHFAFNIKQGHGSRWTLKKLGYKRYMHYWEPEDIKALINLFGFKITYFKSNSPGDVKEDIWTNIIIENSQL